MTISGIDQAIILLYLAGMIFIGWRMAGKQHTVEDFFLAGRRMPWLAVAMSMFASVTSAVTYMGVPGMAYSENIALLAVCVVSPLLAPVLIYLFYPVYDRLHVTTSYEYLEHRFGRGGRFLASGLFLLARLGWMATVVYAPALALSVATSLPLWSTILLMGILATTYTVLGGLSAVIWTDVVQFSLMVLGAVWVAVSLILRVPDGLAGIWTIAEAHNHIQVASAKISIYEMTGLVVGITFFFQLMQEYGTDQVTVQRLMAVKDMRGRMRAILFNAGTDLVVIALLLFVGLGLFAFYQGNPGALPSTIDGDSVLPYYVVTALPVGAAGLLLAAIFAAAMSSMDSGINSLATVVINDFVRPLRRDALSDPATLRLARILTLAFGLAATLLAFAVSSLGQIIKAYTTFISLFSAPVLALFLLGMLTKRGSLSGWLTGCAASIPLTLWLQHIVKAHWVYYFPFSFFVCFLVAYATSLVFPVAPRHTAGAHE
jgi:solute:Na+ symporter, SSS family